MPKVKKSKRSYAKPLLEGLKEDRKTADGDFEVFAFNPIDPRKLYTEEKLEKVLEEMRVDDPTNPMLQDVTFVDKCPLCHGGKNISSEHEYQLHLRQHVPQCPHCLIRLPSWSKYPDHFAHCSRSVRRLKIKNPSKGGSTFYDCYDIWVLIDLFDTVCVFQTGCLLYHSRLRAGDKYFSRLFEIFQISKTVLKIFKISTF